MEKNHNIMASFTYMRSYKILLQSQGKISFDALQVKATTFLFKQTYNVKNKSLKVYKLRRLFLGSLKFKKSNIYKMAWHTTQ